MLLILTSPTFCHVAKFKKGNQSDVLLSLLQIMKDNTKYVLKNSMRIPSRALYEWIKQSFNV